MISIGKATVILSCNFEVSWLVGNVLPLFGLILGTLFLQEKNILTPQIEALFYFSFFALPVHFILLVCLTREWLRYDYRHLRSLVVHTVSFADT